MTVSADGRQVATPSRHGAGVDVWDAATGQEALTLTLKGRKNNSWSAAFSPDGRRIISGNQDGTVMVWNAVTGKEMLTLKGHTYLVSDVAFSPNGYRIVSVGEDNTVRVWDAVTGKEMLTLKVGNTCKKNLGSVNNVAYSADGQRIVFAYQGIVTVWDAETGEETLTLPDVGGMMGGGMMGGGMMGGMVEISSVAFSPDGQQIISGNQDGTVKVWNAVTGQEMLRLKGHAGDVESVAFSPDGQRIISGGQDGTVKVWDAATGQETLTLKGHKGWVFGVAFSSDGRRIVSGDKDGTVIVWDAGPQEDLADPEHPTEDNDTEDMNSAGLGMF